MVDMALNHLVIIEPDFALDTLGFDILSSRMGSKFLTGYGMALKFPSRKVVISVYHIYIYICRLQEEKIDATRSIARPIQKTKKKTSQIAVSSFFIFRFFFFRK